MAAGLCFVSAVAAKAVDAAAKVVLTIMPAKDNSPAVRLMGISMGAILEMQNIAMSVLRVRSAAHLVFVVQAGA
jgi:hypothetical protein